MNADSSNIGHRQRLKERFFLSRNSEIPDYELLELIIFYSNPRKDTKKIAKNLIKTFGNFSSVINANPISLRKIPDIGESAIILFKVLQDASSRLTQKEVFDRPVISNMESLVKYLRVAMGSLSNENFRTLYLNKKNFLIDDKLLGEGTIDQVAIYPREIIKHALNIDASAIILVHNHPSGKATPSQSDIKVTKDIVMALRPINITVHDHIIISQSEEFSFTNNGLL